MRNRMLVALGLLMLGCVGCTGPADKPESQSAKDAYASGHAAEVLEVPSTANPYVGTNSFLAEQWLDGWMNSSCGI